MRDYENSLRELILHRYRKLLSERTLVTLEQHVDILGEAVDSSFKELKFLDTLNKPLDHELFDSFSGKIVPRRLLWAFEEGSPKLREKYNLEGNSSIIHNKWRWIPSVCPLCNWRRKRE